MKKRPTTFGTSCLFLSCLDQEHKTNERLCMCRYTFDAHIYSISCIAKCKCWVLRITQMDACYGFHEPLCKQMGEHGVRKHCFQWSSSHFAGSWFCKCDMHECVSAVRTLDNSFNRLQQNELWSFFFFFSAETFLGQSFSFFFSFLIIALITGIIRFSSLHPHTQMLAPAHTHFSLFFSVLNALTKGFWAGKNKQVRHNQVKN